MARIEAMLGRMGQELEGIGGFEPQKKQPPSGRLTGVLVALGKFLKTLAVVLPLALSLSLMLTAGAVAAEPGREAAWWTNLLQNHNGRSFCLPAGSNAIEVAKELQGYLQGHDLSDSLTEPQAVQLLAQLYPCGGMKGFGNEKLKLKEVRRTNLQLTMDN